MSTHDGERETIEDHESDLEPQQPADPFEPEAPAHLDEDPEAVVHDGDRDDEAVVDGADPTPPQPS